MADQTGVSIKLTPRQTGVIIGSIASYTFAAAAWLTNLHSDVSVLKVEVAEVKQGVSELKLQCKINPRMSLATKDE
jgi:hypothetical protein